MSDLVEYVDRNGDRWAFMAGDHTWLESPAHGGRRCAVWYVLREYGPLVPAGFLADMEGATQDLGEAAEEIERLRAEVASLRQQLAVCSCESSPMTYEGPEPDCPVHGAVRAFNEASAEIAVLRQQLDEARGELRDGLSDRDLLTDVPPDQLVDEVLALIDRGYQQYTELRSLNVDLLADNARLLDVYRAAEAWRDHLSERPSTGWWADLAVAVDAYRADAVWTPAKDGDTPGELVPGEGEVPRPIRAGAEDPHPESYCHRCKGPNISWSAPSPLWNAVMRGNSIIGEWEYDEIICPPCFAALAAERGITGNHWRLFADEVRIKLERITPSGRVWSAKTWMWDLPGEGADRRPVDVLGHAPAEAPDGERA